MLSIARLMSQKVCFEIWVDKKEISQTNNNENVAIDNNSIVLTSLLLGSEINYDIVQWFSNFLGFLAGRSPLTPKITIFAVL